jgi:Flp pilus assembly protein TadD
MESEALLPLSRELSQSIDRMGLEFLAGTYEAELARHPENLLALEELGTVYTRLGRIAEGLAVDRRLVGHAPEDPSVRYNLACSLALSGRPDEALAELERSVELGYDDPKQLETDDDLASLRTHARFQALLARLRAT